VQLPDFDEPSLVDGPRVLAVVAEPPEVNPGQPVHLSLLLASAAEPDIRWRGCGAFDTFLGGSQYGDEQSDEGCGGARAVELGAGETAVLPGALTEQLFDSLDLAEAIFGAALPEGAIEHIRDSVGLPFTIEATVRVDGTLIRAVKRVLISARATPHRNPPPPAFNVGNDAVAAVIDPDVDPEPASELDPSARFTCRAIDGTALRLAPDSEIDLVPFVPDGAEVEPWLERYQVIDMRGELHARDEIAFYSWFATGGELHEGVTKSPLRNEIWRTPRASGCHTLWVVVRDGHGGASACGVAVAVGDRRCD
jgi:hypothetical protein